MKKVIFSAAFALCAMNSAIAATLPDWNIPGIRDTNGEPYYPMWTGNTYMDSAKSTGAERLWNIGITGKGVTVAVLDEPFDINHSAFKNNIIGDASGVVSFVRAGDFFEYMDGLTLLYTYDDGSVSLIGYGAEFAAMPVGTEYTWVDHGTHVAGTIVGMAPDVGLALWHASSWTNAAKTPSDFASFLDTDLAMYAVAELAGQYNIVAFNNSWGAMHFGHENHYRNQFGWVLDGLEDMGVATIFASGNDGVNNAVGAPANMPQTVAVGALSPYGIIASFSNQGRKIAILAPGVNINSSVPFDEYGNMSGTSMAAPHVSGAIGLLASGARNASSQEIVEAIINSGDQVKYDGKLKIPAYMVGSGWIRNPVWREIFNAVASAELQLPTDDWADMMDFELTQDQWRKVELIFSRAYEAYFDFFDGDGAFPNLANPADVLRFKNFYYQAIVDAKYFPDNGNLTYTDYRFLRVDKAYMHLTEARMKKRAEKIGNRAPAAAGMLNAFAGELRADINADTAAIFQRLDAQGDKSIAVAARQISPQFAATALHSAQMGLVGVHRGIGRGEARANIPCRNQQPKEQTEEDSENESPTEQQFDKIGCGNMWVDGFASFGRQSRSIDTGRYTSDFMGITLGADFRKDRLGFGFFGSVAEHGNNGDDGNVKGDWYSVGLYMRAENKEFFVQGSAAYNFGTIELRRDIHIPGAVFSNALNPLDPIVLKAIDRGANSNANAQGFSGHFSGGMNTLNRWGFIFGPRLEASVSMLRHSDFTEDGAGALNLDVDGFTSLYTEIGMGFGLKKSIGTSMEYITLDAKILGMMGSMAGVDMTGSFTNYGTMFLAEGEKESDSQMMLVPELSLRMAISERSYLNAGYSGRFGTEGYMENRASLRFGLLF